MIRANPSLFDITLSMESFYKNQDSYIKLSSSQVTGLDHHMVLLTLPLKLRQLLHAPIPRDHLQSQEPILFFLTYSLLLVVPFASFLHSFPDCALTIGLQHFPSSPSNSILYELSAYTNTSNVCLVTGVFYCFLLLSLLFSLTQAFQLTICSQLLFSL